MSQLHLGLSTQFSEYNFYVSRIQERGMISADYVVCVGSKTNSYRVLIRQPEAESGKIFG
jgi:hypothetical protein